MGSADLAAQIGTWISEGMVSGNPLATVAALAVLVVGTLLGFP